MNQGNCKHCSNQTHYSCSKCKCLVYNRPTCSTPVEIDVQGYSEEHPKAVGICNECKTKPGKSHVEQCKRLSTNFLTRKGHYRRNQVNILNQQPTSKKLRNGKQRFPKMHVQTNKKQKTRRPRLPKSRVPQRLIDIPVKKKK